MAIPLECLCGRRFRVNDNIAGKRVLCPACRDIVDVPSLSATLKAAATASVATLPATIESQDRVHQSQHSHLQLMDKEDLPIAGPLGARLNRYFSYMIASVVILLSCLAANYCARLVFHKSESTAEIAPRAIRGVQKNQHFANVVSSRPTEDMQRLRELFKIEIDRLQHSESEFPLSDDCTVRMPSDSRPQFVNGEDSAGPFSVMSIVYESNGLALLASSAIYRTNLVDQPDFNVAEFLEKSTLAADHAIPPSTRLNENLGESNGSHWKTATMSHPAGIDSLKNPYSAGVLFIKNQIVKDHLYTLMMSVDQQLFDQYPEQVQQLRQHYFEGLKITPPKVAPVDILQQDASPSREKMDVTWENVPDPLDEDGRSSAIRKETEPQSAPPANSPPNAEIPIAKPETKEAIVELFKFDTIPVPEFPDLPEPYHRFESGESVSFLSLPAAEGSPGASMQFRVYLPKGTHSEHSLGCVLMAPAGTNLLVGNDVDAGDYHAEALPYASAGMAVVVYSIDGPLAENARDEQLAAAYLKFKSVCAGVVNGRNAFEFVLKKLPQVDPKKVFCAGHSSAGTLSLLLAEHEPRLAGCVAYAPATDVEKRLQKLRERPGAEALLPDLIAFLHQSSPLSHVKKLKCPVLIFHAHDDDNEPFDNTAEFVKWLQPHNERVKFVQTARGGHYYSMLEEGIPAGVEWLNDLQGIRPPPKADPDSGIAKAERQSGEPLQVFGYESWSGEGDMLTAARTALAKVKLVIADEVTIDEKNHQIHIPMMRSDAYSSRPLKNALLKAGFQVTYGIFSNKGRPSKNP